MIHLTAITLVIGVMSVNHASNRSAVCAAVTGLLIFAVYSLLWTLFVFRGAILV